MLSKRFWIPFILGSILIYGLSHFIFPLLTMQQHGFLIGISFVLAAQLMYSLHKDLKQMTKDMLELTHEEYVAKYGGDN